MLKILYRFIFDKKTTGGHHYQFSDWSNYLLFYLVYLMFFVDFVPADEIKRL